MAKAAKKHTPTTKAGSSDWLSIVKDVFPRWCDHLGSSEDARGELYALLCDRKTQSAKHKVDASGEEIPGTSSFLDAGFWQERASLLLTPDADGGVGHLAVDYTDPADIYLPDGHWEFYVRRLDVERWERLYFPMTAAPLPPPRKPVTSSKKTKPATSSKKQKATLETRLINLMEELELKPGMFPREVRQAIKQPFKNKKYRDQPSYSTITRAYNKHTGTK
jgi:hypothetical protein